MSEKDNVRQDDAHEYAHLLYRANTYQESQFYIVHLKNGASISINTVFEARDYLGFDWIFCAQHPENLGDGGIEIRVDQIVSIEGKTDWTKAPFTTVKE